MIWTSTRDPTRRASFLEASAASVPGDGGLFVPAALAPLEGIGELLALPREQRLRLLFAWLLGGELGRDDAARLADATFSFPVPLIEVEPGRFALELFHGPSLSFKDFGVGFLARLLERERSSADRKPRTVLTATSGDTGAAVAHAFHERAGFRVAVLYPRGRISAAQERQIATLGGNVRALAVDGSFDDCQRLVKAAFADARLARTHRLIAANSIHPARLLAQIVYYFDGVAELRRRDPSAPAPVVAVPSGNFGNLAAGVIARRLGLPIGRLLLATNDNRTVPEHLDGAAYRPRPSVATLSNAMDVGAPNNWERVLWLHGGAVERVRAEVGWGSATDDETLAEVARLAAIPGRSDAGYRADPHGAVASKVLREQLPEGVPGIFLATAHPAKFEATAAGAPLPEPLARALELPLRSEPLAADQGALALALAGGWPADREELP